jgi:hypothetical protein
MCSHLPQLNDGGLFKWNIGLMVINPESAFDGGYFKVSAMPLDVTAAMRLAF